MAARTSPRRPRHRPAQGRRYSWGYPACPEQSEHEKVFRLLDAPSIGLRLSGGYAVEPEQSTLAIVAHHPQAVYFGMKSGFLPKTDKQARDELIAGTDKDPTRLADAAATRIPATARGLGRTASRRWPRPERTSPSPRRRELTCVMRYAAGRSASSSRLSASSDSARRSSRRTASCEMPEPASGLAERRRVIAVDPVAELDDLAFALGQALERAPQRVVAQCDLDLLVGPSLIARQQRPERGRPPPRPPAGQGS